MFQYTYQIQKEDINHGNHVGNERTLVFFKKAREAWLAEKNYSELSIGEGCGIIQKSACIEYRKQIFLQDTIDVNIIKIELEKLFFIFFYIILIFLIRDLCYYQLLKRVVLLLLHAL